MHRCNPTKHIVPHDSSVQPERVDVINLLVPLFFYTTRELMF